MNYLSWFWRNSRGIRWNSFVRIVVGIGVGYWLTTAAGVRQTNALRLRIFSSLFRRQLYAGDPLHSGDVTSRLSKDIEQVSSVCTEDVPQMVITLIQLCGAFLLMRWFDARLAWVLLVLTPLAIVFGKLIVRRLRQMTLDIRQDESQIQMQVQEGMEHNAVLRSLGAELWVTDRLDTMQQRLRGNVMRRTRFTVIARIIMGCAFGLGYLLAFVWGGIGLRNGTITFGVMTSFLQLVGMIQHPILQLLNMVPGVIHATASIDRLEELESESNESQGLVRDSALNHDPVPRDSAASDSALNHDPVPHDSSRAAINFDDVTFRYATGDREILSHFTHHFQSGTKTAIMGETGIGKTTLFRLMLGFMQPTQGRVTVGGDICFVPQGNTLMSGTIRYNLLLAKPDATDDELRHVLHIACADFVFDLPYALSTELGERGGGLSEGQAQRIAIARGLLHGGDIFLFDEISSSLDETTERDLFARLFATYPQKTIIFITHRTSIAALCNDVVRL